MCVCVTVCVCACMRVQTGLFQPRGALTPLCTAILVPFAGCYEAAEETGSTERYYRVTETGSVSRICQHHYKKEARVFTTDCHSLCVCVCVSRGLSFGYTYQSSHTHTGKHTETATHTQGSSCLQYSRMQHRSDFTQKNLFVL